jgi:hypothetical protein
MNPKKEAVSGSIVFNQNSGYGPNSGGSPAHALAAVARRR